MSLLSAPITNIVISYNCLFLHKKIYGWLEWKTATPAGKAWAEDPADNKLCKKMHNLLTTS